MNVSKRDLINCATLGIRFILAPRLNESQKDRDDFDFEQLVHCNSDI